MSILNIEKLKTIKQSSIVTKYFQQSWLLTLHISCTIIILLCNSCSSWIIVNDLNEQIEGLVYDRISKFLTGQLILFNIIELTFSIIELFLWINLLKKHFKLWIIIDCITIINIYLAEIPLSLLNAYICACHDSIVSIGFIIKGSFIIMFICLRLSICFISCNYEKTNEFTKNSFNINLNEEQHLLHNNENYFNENYLCKSIYWPWIRIGLCTGLFCLIILICTIFSFLLISLNSSNLQWYQLNINQSNVKMIFQHDYLHDVEIFLEDNTNQSEIKWYHLLSLQQIIQLKQINANESVLLTFHYDYNKKQKLIKFKQIIHYSNNTKIHWSTCWQIIKYDLYKEITCPLLRNQSIRLIYGMKITFIYIEPSKKQHYGNVLYNITRVSTGSRKIREHDLKLKYFQNTIVHLSSKKSTELQSNHGHDEWSSGPFRSYNLQVDDELYTKYRSTDLVPIQKLWKTGIAKCQSTAPIGPQKI